MRNVLSAWLIFAACALVPLGTLSAWTTYEIGDTDAYVATMAPLAGDPAVRDAIADAVTDGIMHEVRAGPLQDRVRGFVREAVGSFTGTDAFRVAWTAANRAAHHAVMRALRSGSSREVSIDLAPITEQLKQRLVEDGASFAGRIPVEHTEVTVLQARDPEKLRKGFHMFQIAGLWLPVASVLLAVGGILVALRRRHAVAMTALGMALSAGLLAVAIVVGRGLTLDDLPPDVSRDAAGAVYDALTDSLRTAAWIIIALGVTVAAATWITTLVLRRRATPDPTDPPPPPPTEPTQPTTPPRPQVRA
ncbi:hypothetical protein ACIQNU_42595 [Streptomyces sp. NPDC091292]|uniref:hypothetical protein n=1 Tax=Streptomyces sp. NPDC091292 TaxID=3365991 RepID=UPI003803D4EF